MRGFIGSWKIGALLWAPTPATVITREPTVTLPVCHVSLRCKGINSGDMSNLPSAFASSNECMRAPIALTRPVFSEGWCPFSSWRRSRIGKFGSKMMIIQRNEIVVVARLVPATRSHLVVFQSLEPGTSVACVWRALTAAVPLSRACPLQSDSVKLQKAAHEYQRRWKSGPTVKLLLGQTAVLLRPSPFQVLAQI